MPSKLQFHINKPLRRIAYFCKDDGQIFVKVHRGCRSRRIEEKVALITGGASGIGQSTARLFLQHGARKLSYVLCDITCETDVKIDVDTAISMYGKLDIMFNNVGIGGDGEPGILACTNESFKKLLDVNLFGAFLRAKHAARYPVLSRVDEVQRSSKSNFPLHAFTASKHAVVGLAKNLCVELGQYEIRVNSISPFGVASPMTTDILNMGKKKTDEFISSGEILKGAVLEPEGIAQAALYLASDEAKYVSVINLVVDGGYSLTNPSFAIALETFSPSPHS
ncbi:secoisolariciresinol dehydrogenase [Manihot esculenta]|uniref:secoisolariciresinol dehydrogenase n=1 Tax=Manihot esculenta TaxID=3983 RepID=UPI000B5D49B0|nr:secoisolariciresinol dehydrogenase [Manihot esculenta]